MDPISIISLSYKDWLIDFIEIVDISASHWYH
jgi:hypothetical protein